MANLEIKIYPDPVLKEKAKPVTTFDSKLKKFVENMIETMYVESGIGLAANQVGSLERVFVVDVSEDGNNPLVFINPEITERSGKKKGEEGCLSIPSYRDVVERSTTITIKAQDISGQEFTLQADGLMAVCIQHELDHLDGILFVDRLSHLKKQLFKKWLEKNLGPE